MAYLGYSVSIHCGHVQVCDISVSNPLVTPIHNGTTCVNMVFFFSQNGCFEGYC